jgi:hypothetical protein
MIGNHRLEVARLHIVISPFTSAGKGLTANDVPFNPRNHVIRNLGHNILFFVMSVDETQHVVTFLKHGN